MALAGGNHRRGFSDSQCLAKPQRVEEQTPAEAAAHLSALEAPTAHKWIIALSVMLGTILEILDVSRRGTEARKIEFSLAE